MSKSGVPGPRGLPVLGNAIEFGRDPLAFLDECFRQHGDLFVFQLLGRKLYVVSHPDDIERLLVRDHADMIKDRFTKDLSRALGDGLVTSEGEHWKRQRKLVSHAFTPARIESYAGAMVSVAERATAGWQPGQIIDLHAEMTRVTLDVVAKTLFDADVSSDTRSVGEAMKILSDFAVSLEAGMLLPDWVPGPAARRARRAVAQIDEVLFRIIGERRKSREKRGDLLSALIFAEDESGGKMSDRELRDETATLFLAGHETTALALSYAIFFLSKHPEIEGRWRSELGRVLGGRAPSSSDVPLLDLTSRILKETMRLYPPVWAIGRENRRELELRGYRIPAGSQLSACQWIVHRDPRWFSDPEAFDPDRWSSARVKDLPRFAYFPFGGGPRICIGNHFATLEAIVLLALFGQRFHFELLPGQRLDFLASVTLRPKSPIRMRLREIGRPSVEERAAGARWTERL